MQFLRNKVQYVLIKIQVLPTYLNVDVISVNRNYLISSNFRTTSSNGNSISLKKIQYYFITELQLLKVNYFFFNRVEISS